MDRKKVLSKKNQIPMLIAALALIGTSSLIGHGAASGESPALVLDYIHNLVAAIWIGGIFYFVFTLLPTFSQLKESTSRKDESSINSKILNSIYHCNRNCNNYRTNSYVVLRK